MFILKLLAAILALSVVTMPVMAARFTNAPYTVCFTPGGACTADIVQALGQARHTVLVQAYSFTSAPIAKALIDAKGRGVDVRVLLDKSQRKERYSSYTMLQNQHIPVWIDSKVAIAHNKVMIIDGETVITGSFNFTSSAQKRNAENVLIIHDGALANTYAGNWDKRFKASQAD